MISGADLRQTSRSARGLAGGKFDDFRGDFFLPHDPLGRLQNGKLALDLAARRSHRLHARLVLRREGV